MDIDVTQMLGAVEREVLDREGPDGSLHVVRIRRTYDTTIEDLWDAVTSAERIPRWFLPVSGDLRVGGRFQLQGNAGGEVLACEAPHRFSITWEMGDDISWVDVALGADSAGGTQLVLEHAAQPGEHWEKFGPGAVGIGWELGLMGLVLHLASGGAPVDPAEVMQWQMGEGGRAMVRGSNDAWCAAAIAAGTPEAEARARADRTLAAYRGEAV